MSRRVAVITASALAIGCASGGGGGPTYSLGPDAGELRYEVRGEQSMLIDTPMGAQQSDDAMEATVTFTIGGAVADGWEVAATYEALSVRSSGDMGSTNLSGGELIGQVMRGTLSPTGSIAFDGRPTVASGLADAFDPAGLLSDFFVYMPADGNTSAPWPVSRQVVFETAMHLTLTFEGTARIAGDTVWNGVPATVIVVEGETTLEGSGTPPGAPGELTMSFTGSSTRRYVWDAAHGIMLAAWGEDDVGGPIVIQGFDLEMSATATGTYWIELKR